MAVSKCSKCGANIPGGATFCPSCGAPKAGEQPAPQPVQSQPVPVAPSQPMGSSLQGLANTMFSTFMIVLGICIGTLLAFISLIIITYGGGGGAQAGFILNLLAFGGMSILMIGGGLLNYKLHPYVRAALIAAGGVVLVWALSSTNLFATAISQWRVY